MKAMNPGRLVIIGWHSLLSSDQRPREQVSAQASNPKKERRVTLARYSGADAYLLKPYNTAMLQSKLDAIF